MTRMGALLGGMCAVVLAMGPGLAHAQSYPENTPEACSDRVDNDGDGYMDCYDPDCHYLQLCQQQGAPPPQYQQQPQYPPPQYPPPQYPPPSYAQPQYAPPAYAQPQYAPPPRPPSTGVGEIVTGFILFPVGVLLLGTSAILWEDSSLASSGSRFNNFWGALVMDIFGSAMFIVGAIMIPAGFVKAGKYAAWKRQQQQRTGMIDLGHGVSLMPTAGATSDSARLGFKLSF